MSLAYVAALPLPLLMPSVQLSIGIPAISLNASLTGALALNASLTITPPTVALYLSALVELQAQLSLGISLGTPSVSFDASACAALVAQLELCFSLLITLDGLLGASIGMYAFTYNGAANAMGAALTGELSSTWPDGVSSSGACNVALLGAASPIAQTQLAAFFDGLAVGSGLVYTAKLAALSALTPVTFAATAQGHAAISAQLSAALQVQASVQVTPPTLAITAEALAKFAANLEASLSLAPPSVSAAISATANLAASISAQFGLMVALGATLDRYDAELFCYTYSGTGGALGAAVTSALASTWGDGHTSTSSGCIAAILATTDPATWAVMTAFFGGL
jgi:hypothetical protein